MATDSNATIAIAVNGTPITNGTAATWDSGDNTVEITVTNGTVTTYTITVSKE